MRPSYLLILLFFLTTLTLHAQDDNPVPAHEETPPRRCVRSLVERSLYNNLKKEKYTYWNSGATWCGPCKAAMPHLSVVAEKYRNKVTIIGVDIYEQPTTPFGKIKRFVDSMGKRMDYLVAAEDSNFMATTWLRAAGEQAIPRRWSSTRKEDWHGSGTRMNLKRCCCK